MSHPLDSEDLAITIWRMGDSPNVMVSITHIITGTVASASGTDEQTVRLAASDDLLSQLETISG